MDSLFQHSPGDEGDHPPRERLLLYVDGELSPRKAAQVQAHLEACWQCRVKTKKVEETIADIVDFDERLLKAHVAAPGGWHDFGRRLDHAAAEGGARSRFSHVLGWLRGLVPPARALAAGSPLLVRVVAVVLVAAVALVVYVDREPVVSAGALLRRAAEAQEAALRSADRPVVYQKLRVRRGDRGDALTVEVWQAADSRVRHSVEAGDGRRVLVADSAGPGVLGELADVLRANGLDASRPLSAAAFAAWRDSLGAARDTVSRTQAAGDADALELRTAPEGPVGAARIAEAALVVRARDFRPVAERLRVVAADGERVYEIVETDFEVTSLAAVPREVFAGDETASAPPSAAPAPGAPPSAAPAVPGLPAPARPLATYELEVRVLGLLHEAGADTGEQVSAERTPDGLLRVTGVVDTEARKREILAALGPVASDPAVLIQVETAAEAERRQAGTAAGPVRVEQLAPSANAMPAEAHLRRHLAARGVPEAEMDREVSRFAIRVSTRARRSLQHAWALKRLVARFSPEQVRALAPDARAEWLALVRAHAAAARRESSTLRDELAAVFSAGAPAGSDDGLDASAEAGLARAAERLVELCAASEGVVGSLFSASSNPSRTAAAPAPQFWRSLSDAAALAARIEQANRH